MYQTFVCLFVFGFFSFVFKQENLLWQLHQIAMDWESQFQLPKINRLSIKPCCFSVNDFDRNTLMLAYLLNLNHVLRGRSVCQLFFFFFFVFCWYVGFQMCWRQFFVTPVAGSGLQTTISILFPHLWGLGCKNLFPYVLKYNKHKSQVKVPSALLFHIYQVHVKTGKKKRTKQYMPEHYQHLK